MSSSLVAVADGRDSLFATLGADGIVSVWSGPDALQSRFSAGIARASVPVPSHRLAIVMGVGEISVVVGSWSQGVAAFDVDGATRWHRKDIRHVQRLRAVPIDEGEHSIVTVVQERNGGLVLGQTGGTRHPVARAQFLDGWRDASLLVFDREGVSRRTAPYKEDLWRVDLATFAVLDAVLDHGALICGADGTLTYVSSGGEVIWRVPAVATRRIVSARAHPDGDGWICLSVSNVPRGVPQVLKVNQDGEIATTADFPGTWIGFVCGGRCIVAANGTVAKVPGLARPPG
jgi:hypothetical protein